MQLQTDMCFILQPLIRSQVAPIRFFSPPPPLQPLHLASASVWACVAKGGYCVEQAAVAESTLKYWSHGWLVAAAWLVLRFDALI